MFHLKIIGTPILKLLLEVIKVSDFVVWVQAESKSGTNESILKVALDHGKAFGIIKPHDRVVVCQKVGDSSVVKIIELEDWFQLMHNLISQRHNKSSSEPLSFWHIYVSLK